MKVYMFPGQGSQSKGMGGELFDRFEDLTAKADAVLGYSVKELCLEDPRNELGRTQFTQPALYVVNALSYFGKVEDAGASPDYLAGHSLGEFDALMAARCFDFETGLKLVRKRGELMAGACDGAMVAVMNAQKEDIEEKLKEGGLMHVHLANYNTPSQIVLSGRAEEIAQAQKLLRQGKVRCYPLATSGAFHSVLMQDAMRQFTEFLQGFRFAAPQTPVIANVTARPYESGAVAETLASQITGAVRWCESIQYLLALGAAGNDAVAFEEVGHGDVLTRLVHTIRAQTPEDELRRIAAAQAPAEAAGAPAAAQAGKAAPAASTAEPMGADAKVAVWNERYRIGTKVRSSIADYGDLETRTEAMVLFGHRAAVYMKGYNGYFDLDEVSPA